MKVKKITASVNDAQAVPQVLDNEGVSFQKIDIVNWKEYPYHPEAAFRIAHTADSILIHYKVTEGSVRAKYGEDNGAVWTDSCMEFFSIPQAMVCITIWSAAVSAHFWSGQEQSGIIGNMHRVK